MDVQPGEIYLAYYDAKGGTRPFVVVSRVELNRGNYVLAVPFTTQNLDVRRTLPNCVKFSQGSWGLWKDCVAQADALTQLRKSDLAEPLKPLGALSSEKLAEIVGAIGNAIGADCELGSSKS